VGFEIFFGGSREVKGGQEGRGTWVEGEWELFRKGCGG